MNTQSTPKDDHRKTVGEWLNQPFEWRIPVYQRHYAWDSEIESGPIHLFWETVEEQTVARLDGQKTGKKPPQHYLGAVLVDNKTDPTGAIDGITRWDVVDGQQRLTTIQIALLALIRVATDEYQHGDQIKKGLEDFVFSDKGSNRPRLVPTNFDKQQFEKVLFDVYDVLPDVGSPKVSKENANKSKIVSTFEFFKGAYKSLVEKCTHDEIDVIRAIKESLLDGFDIVLIALRDTDEAQKIFESLNNYAKPLTTFDLIRNNVFDRAAKKAGMDVKLFWSPAWQQMEKPYWEGKADNRKTGWNTHIEAYIARMLVAKMQKEVRFNRNEIFRTYKEFHKTFPSIDEEISGLVDYLDIYRHLDGDTERNPVDPDVDFGVFRYGIWPNRDFYPVIFLIADSGASAQQKRRMIRLLECYVIRRGVCKLSLTPYNKHAPSICTELGDNPSYEALSKMLKTATKDTTVFPDDERVKASCVNEKFYKSPFQRYVFECIEKSMHSLRVEKVDVAEGQLTIDHILPQGWEKNEEWKHMMLGANSDRSEADVMTIEASTMVINAYLDTIGNLTLMSGPNNSVKSNRPLDKVKDLLEDSTVKLNRQLANETSWNLEKITARSKELATKICEIWPYEVPE